jgi:cytochrome c oxidase subunit 3
MGYEFVSVGLAFPLLNCMLLVGSGLWCTLAHVQYRWGSSDAACVSWILGLVLAVAFTGVQAYEYTETPLCIQWGLKGTSFFVLTGLHGLHVLAGSGLLFAILLRAGLGWVAREVHPFVWGGLTYWHFVDVVWLLLVLVVYVCGRKCIGLYRMDGWL